MQTRGVRGQKIPKNANVILMGGLKKRHFQTTLAIRRTDVTRNINDMQIP